MASIIFCILSALVVIFIAWLLVRWQNRQCDISKKLEDDVRTRFGEIITDYSLLTGEDPTERTLSGVELSIKKIYDRFKRITLSDCSYERSKSRYVKRKKNFTDD